MRTITRPKVYRILAGTMLVVGFFAIPFSSRSPAGNAPSGAKPRQLAQGDSLTLDIAPMLSTLESVRRDDRSEQLADWALFGTLLELPLTPEGLRKASFDRLPIRRQGLGEAVNYDFGHGRRVVLDDGSVLLFYSAADGRRTATLGRLADQVRMERGDIPTSFGIYRFRVDLPDAQIVVSREADIPGATLFSAEYGYVERAVRGVGDLRAFLDATDDVTRALVRPDMGLVLGGRRFADARTRGASLEEVASLYVAHDSLRSQHGPDTDASPGFSLDPRWNLTGAASDLRLLRDRPQALIEEARRIAPPAAVAETASTLSIEARTASDVLDVHYARTLMNDQWRARIDSLIDDATDGRLAALTSRRLLGRSLTMTEEYFPQFERLRQNVKVEAAAGDSVAMGLDELTHFVSARNRFQCARYDGPMQGTRAGMVLFYTDLIAKMWGSTDYGHSAPADSVFGFLTNLNTLESLEPAFYQEMVRLPNTRLWFGPKPEGYATAESRNALNFSHIATRVYSAGSNPVDPGHETKASEPSGRQIGWWDHHYEAIADYEPMYHEQNQIMKWSVITGWLQQKSLLSDLTDSVPVARNNRFDQWYATQTDLRFRYPLRFLPTSRWPKGRECIEIVRSTMATVAGPRALDEWYVEGGVTLGSSRTVSAATHIAEDIAVAERRAGILYEESSAGRLITARKTTFEFPAPSRGRAAVDIGAQDGALRLRLNGTELQTSRLSSEFASDVRGARVAMYVDATDFGSLATTRGPTALRLQWSDGVLSRDQDLIAGIARARVPDPVAGASRSQLALPSEHAYVVERSDGADVLFARADARAPRALHLTLGDEPAPNAYLTSSAQARGTTVTAATHDPSALAKELSDMPWQRLSDRAQNFEPDAEVSRVFTQTGPGKDGIAVQLQTGRADIPSIDAVVKEDKLFLRRPVSATPESFNDFVLEHDFTSRSLVDVVDRAQAGAKTINLAEPGLGRLSAVGRSVARGDEETAVSLLRRAAHDGKLSEAVDGMRDDALDLGIDRYRFGERSSSAQLFAHADVATSSGDELALKALAQLDRNDVAHAAGTLRQAVERGDLSSGAVRAVSIRARAAGNGEVDDLLRLGGPENPRGLVLEVEHNRFYLMATVRDGEHTLVPPAERHAIPKAILDGDAHLYVDKDLVGKIDIEPQSGASLARVAADPNLVWERVETGALAQPGELRVGAHRYARLTERESFMPARTAYIVRRRVPSDGAQPDSLSKTVRKAS
jgi:hypothetical protein